MKFLSLISDLFKTNEDLAREWYPKPPDGPIEEVTHQMCRDLGCPPPNNQFPDGP